MTHNHACAQTLGNKCAWETNAGTATHTEKVSITVMAEQDKENEGLKSLPLKCRVICKYQLARADR